MTGGLLRVWHDLLFNNERVALVTFCDAHATIHVTLAIGHFPLFNNERVALVTFCDVLVTALIRVGMR
jgi:hypothetical protein